MGTEEIEKSLINYINSERGISTSFGKLEFNKSNRIGQGGMD